ncbi:MAG: mannosyltransferase family protein [Candidatus Pacebacteria bacterium]|nr:mannosyltransferase family protein [Candidatus Paceibacterota bacterium]
MMQVSSSKKKGFNIWVFILFLFFFTRIILTFCGIYILSENKELFFENSPDPLYKNIDQNFLNNPYNLILTTWIHWDSRWYLEIAENGYTMPSNDNTEAPWAFFPLYPALIKIFSFLFLGDLKLSGLFVSNICLILSAYFLYKLVLKHWNSEKLAKNSVVYLFLFPVSFLFSSILSESLFLLLSLLTFYFSQKKNWFYAGVVGLFASLTRSIGCLLFIPILFDYFKSKNFKFKKIDFKIGYLFLIPLGTLLYFSYLYFLTGDFFTWFNTEKAGWGMEFSFKNFLIFFKNGLFSGTFYPAFNVWFTFLVLIVVFLSYKELAQKGLVSYFIFSLVFIIGPIFFISNPIFSHSLPRYCIVAFPLFIYFSLLSKNSQLIDTALKVFFSILQLFLMGLWCFSSYFII